jgi:ribosomal protein L37AE/L43A
MAVVIFNSKKVQTNMRNPETPNIEIRCPKCGSLKVERTKNQECHCNQCGEIFYFVTPKCGSQADLGRYDL